MDKGRDNKNELKTQKWLENIRLTIAWAGIALFISGCVTSGVLPKSGFIKKHPELSDKEKKAISSGELSIGMTKDMVIAAMGNPEGTHAYELNNKAMETWIYHKNFFIFGKDAYVKFEDDKVTGWDIR